MTDVVYTDVVIMKITMLNVLKGPKAKNIHVSRQNQGKNSGGQIDDLKRFIFRLQISDL